MVCVAQVTGDSVETGSSTQVPNLMTGSGANDLPALTGFKPENVKYHNMFIGGGFGRRLYYEMSGTISEDGRLLAFRHKVIGPNFHFRRQPSLESLLRTAWLNKTTSMTIRFPASTRRHLSKCIL